MHMSDLNEKHTGLTLVGSPTLGSLLALSEEPLGWYTRKYKLISVENATSELHARLENAREGRPSLAWRA